MIYQLQADDNNITQENVQKWLNAFKYSILPRRVNLGAYYDGKNKIIKQGAVDGRPNYSINVNMAKYIVDVATGYTFGIPIKYELTAKNSTYINAMQKIKDINKNCNSDELDFQIGGDMSTYGIAYQLMLVKDGTEPIEDRITFKRLSPEQTFYVIDNTLLQNVVCSVYFYNYKENSQIKVRVYVYTDTDLHIFDGVESNITLVETMPHNMGSNPIIQCLNNDDAFSDFESVIGILDALSLSISNNTDDLQSIANALLNVQGAVLNEGGIKEVNDTHVINSPLGAKVEWVIKNINPDAQQKHIDNLLKFLFQISQVPDLSDDAFGGSQSGVAMQYKLWGIDQLWGTKTIKYEKALFQRIKILLHLLQFQITNNIDLLNNIEITFSKNLPKNNSDLYQKVQALHGVVSTKTLLKEIPFVEDVDLELEELDREAQKQADNFGFNNNSDLEDGE